MQVKNQKIKYKVTIMVPYSLSLLIFGVENFCVKSAFLKLSFCKEIFELKSENDFQILREIFISSNPAISWSRGPLNILTKTTILIHKVVKPFAKVRSRAGTNKSQLPEWRHIAIRDNLLW